MRAAGTNQEQLNKLLLNDPGIQASLKELLDEFKQNASFDERSPAYLQLMNACHQQGLRAKFIGGGNNKNILISSERDDEVSVFIQFSRKDKRVMSVIKLLYGDQKNPARWLPNIIKETSKQVVDVNTKQPGDDVFSCVMMESCPRNITSLAKENGRISPQQHEYLFRQLYAIASQIEAMISMMKDKKMIWKDMKRENILLRENGDIVVSDVKAFNDVADLPVNARTGFIQFMEATNQYLSPHAQSELMAMKREDFSDKDVMKAWEREYNYQLAVILYEMATGDIATPERNQDGKFQKIFDFHHPVFQSKDGQKFMKMLEAMSHPDDPRKRMNAKNCVSALRKLDANNASSPRLFGGVKAAFDAVVSVFSTKSSPAMQRRKSLAEGELPELPRPVPGMGGHRAGGKK